MFEVGAEARHAIIRPREPLSSVGLDRDLPVLF